MTSAWPTLPKRPVPRYAPSPSAYSTSTPRLPRPISGYDRSSLRPRLGSPRCSASGPRWPASYCQPRGRPVPAGHPATVWLREDRVLDALTTFFNMYVLGPDRAELVAASLPVAAEHAVVQHQRQEEIIQRQLIEVNDGMDNLIRALERTRDPGGQFAGRTQRRIAQLEEEAADIRRQLHSHQAAAPPPPANDVTVLSYLPIAAIDLDDLAVDRLRRFLDAFNIEIHYDCRSRRATVRAEISAEFVDRLAPGRGMGELAASWSLRVETQRRGWPRRRRRGQQNDHEQLWVVPPAGFEPAPPPPEGGALSPELRGLSPERVPGVPETARAHSQRRGWAALGRPSKIEGQV
jgi:hypothetical protein